MSTRRKIVAASKSVGVHKCFCRTLTKAEQQRQQKQSIVIHAALFKK